MAESNKVDSPPTAIPRPVFSAGPWLITPLVGVVVSCFAILLTLLLTGLGGVGLSRIFEITLAQATQLQLLGLGVSIFALLSGKVITAHQQTEKKLRNSLTHVEQIKQEWETTVDTLPELVCLLDEQGRVVRSNRIVEAWGLGTVSKVKGESVHHLLHPTCTQANCYLVEFWPQAWAGVTTGKIAELEVADEVLHRHFYLQILPLANPTRRRHEAIISVAVLIVQDVTARKLTEAALQDSEERFRQVISSISDHIYVTDVTEDGCYINPYLSSHAEALTGYPLHKFVADWTFWPSTVIHPEDRTVAAKQASQLEQGHNSEVEYRLVRANGTVVWVRDSGRVEQYSSVKTIYGVVSDITERKALEEMWRRYEFIVNASKELMTLINQDYAYEAVNEAYCQAHRKTRDEVIGKVVTEVWGQERYQNGIKAHLDRCFSGKEVRYQEWFEFATLGRRYFDVAYYPYRNKTGVVTHVVVVSRDMTENKLVEDELQKTVQQLEVAYKHASAYAQDLHEEITERELMEEALRQSEERTRSVVNNVVDGIITIDTDYQIETFNPAAESIFGYTAAEIVGKTINLLIPDQLDEWRTGAHSREMWGLRQDNTSFPIDLAVSEFQLGDQQMFIGIVRDITEQKNLEEQLRQAQKLEAIGRLAGGIAHDFNNILTVISGYSELLLRQCPDPADPRREDILLIKNASARATNLTRQLLAFSRQQNMHPQIVNLNIVITNLEKILHGLLTSEIALTTALAADLSQVRADPGQIDQVLMNLAVNARDAMPRGGRLTIETANINLTQTYIKRHFKVTPGNYVLLTVTDTGTGMDDNTLRQIFDPFFTTKETGKGTGLGLSTVYGIVRQSEGYIVVDSQLDQGTTFQIYLPRLKDKVEAVTVPEVISQTSLRGTETILLVEDETNVRRVAHRFLQKQGYTVLEADHPQVALEICQQYQGHIDLLITDVIMPTMNGRELAEQLVSTYPHLKVLYISGYTDDALSEHGVLATEIMLLEKPFSSEALAQKVREALRNGE